MPLVAARGLSRRYGRRAALEPTDLTLEGGRVVYLAGGNGAGKTTLLRLLATSLAPTAGSLLLGGHDVARERLAARRIVGLHWEGRRLYEGLTARENLVLLARLAGNDARSPDEVLAWADLADRADEPVGSLSQGMRARLELSSTLVHRPSLLLLDEPFAGLDAAHRSLVGVLVSKVVEGGGAAVVTSHEARSALEVADRVWALVDGRLAGDGDAAGVEEPELLRLLEGGAAS